MVKWETLMARLLWNFGLQLDNNVAKLRTVNQETLQQEAVVVHVYKFHSKRGKSLKRCPYENRVSPKDGI